MMRTIAALTTGAATSSILNGQTPKPDFLLGLDGHSLRGMKWKAPQHIEYAATQKLDAVLFNGFHYFDNLTDSYLQEIRDLADSHHIQIRIGAGGVTAGASSFKPRYGTPLEAMSEGIRIAKILGSPTVNCRIGNIDDRYTPGGIQARIAEAVTTLQAIKAPAQDVGLRFAFENHAGDTRSEEVLQLIEAVGTDFCGVMFDPGNALWAMEDPTEALQILGPHILCTSVRDYRVWEEEDGAMFQWTALGEGLMDVPAYTTLFREFCPEVPFFVETISNQHRPIPFLTEAFMKGFPDLKASGITSFLKLCRQGEPLPILTPAAGEDPKKFDQQIQKKDFETSIALLRTLS
ncbi:MAG: TIM barrel protein [Verrucomicrobiota bacterium]